MAIFRLLLPTNASQSKQEIKAASNIIPLETFGRHQDQLETIKNVNAEGSLPEESPSSTAAAAGVGSSGTPLRQQSAEGQSNLSVPRQCSEKKAEQEEVKETELSADKLFNLDEDAIKELRHSSFIHSEN